jgi:hypothetical protein
MKNPNRVTYYEWDVESIDPDTGDILDHDHRNTFADCFRSVDEENTAIVLVKTHHDYDFPYKSFRSWSYFDKETMTLSEEFENGDKVPKRFLAEVKKATK